VLSLIPVEASVTVFGVSPKASKNLREVLIVASALVGCFSGMLSRYIEIMDEIVASFVDRQSKGDKDVSEFLGLGLGTNFWFLPSAAYGHASTGLGFLALLSVIGLLGITLLFCTVFGAAYIHWCILRDIYVNPSFSVSASIWVIGFVLACDFFTLLLAFLSNGGLPLQDLTNMMSIAKMGEKDPQKASRIYEAMAREYLRRPWFIRLVSRVKMPKSLPPV
jgi:hypothetical protein